MACIKTFKLHKKIILEENYKFKTKIYNNLLKLKKRTKS
jgi:hypothetical protein